jgi:hypothetical protein
MSYMKMRVCLIGKLRSTLRLFKPRGNWHLSLLNNTYYNLSRRLVTDARNVVTYYEYVRLSLLRLLESREYYNLF